MNNLDKDLQEMRRLGYTSYGKYKLDHPNTKVVKNKTSKSAAKRNHSIPAQYNLVCAECEKEFVSARSYQLYCSDVCKDKAARKRCWDKKKKCKTKTYTHCAICGTEFEQRRLNHIYCSTECHDEGNRRCQRLWRQRQKGANDGASI